ncbi:hypothetical protein AVEN_18186-1 [Araneus ventricosus]|uniref:Uncharacterized protein n=1 Tax=Araneus ventricosus TaxID=182803 RepID=A0A4Y2AII2_ARAVE|nr:hypothetical protein AVEN_18186-1 [Araneus ventricosus]
MWAWCTLNLTPWVKRPTTGVVRKLGEEVPAQVSSSSSDRCSQLRGPYRNNPRVASKWDVNITKHFNYPQSPVMILFPSRIRSTQRENIVNIKKIKFVKCFMKIHQNLLESKKHIFLEICLPTRSHIHPTGSVAVMAPCTGAWDGVLSVNPKTQNRNELDG